MTGRPDAARFGAEVLKDFASRVLIAAGAAPDAARICAEVFIDADLAGADTHGIMRLRQYVQALVSGRVDGHARPEVVADHGAVVTVDARNGPGPVGLAFATDVAVRTARRHGVAAVAVRGSNHAGAMAWYTDRAVAAGMFALVLSGSTKAMVAPAGGAAPFIGTNAVAYGVSAGAETLIFDASTSVASRSRLEAFQRAGTSLPPGWAIDPDGKPALDPAEVIEGIDRLSGHSLLPFGGAESEHKGFGIGLLVELLCGPIAGARWGPTPPDAAPVRVGHFVLCLDLGAFGAPAEEITARVGSLSAALRAAPAAVDQTPVRMPGDRRRECAIRYAGEGIPVPANVLAELDQTAALLNVPPLTRSLP